MGRVAWTEDNYGSHGLSGDPRSLFAQRIRGNKVGIRRPITLFADNEYSVCPACTTVDRDGNAWFAWSGTDVDGGEDGEGFGPFQSLMRKLPPSGRSRPATVLGYGEVSGLLTNSIGKPNFLYVDSGDGALYFSELRDKKPKLSSFLVAQDRSENSDVSVLAYDAPPAVAALDNKGKAVVALWNGNGKDWNLAVRRQN